MSEMITRCPKCSTAFRISQAHLRSAKGVVRCGSCLSVFDAKAHMETRPRKAKPAAAESASSSSKAFSIANKLKAEQSGQAPVSAQTRVNEPEQSQPPAKAHQQSEITATQEQHNAAEIKAKIDSHPEDVAQDNEESFDINWQQAEDASISASSTTDELSEDITNEITDDISADDNKTSKSNKADEDDFLIDDHSPLFDENEDDESGNNRAMSRAKASTRPKNIVGSHDDEAWALELLKDDGDSELTIKKVVENSSKDDLDSDDSSSPSGAAPALDDDFSPEFLAASSNSKPSDEEFDKLDETLSESLGDSNAESEEETQASSSKSRAAKKYEAAKQAQDKDQYQEFLAGIEPDPLEVDWQENQQPLAKKLLWPLLVLAAALVLMVQIAWLEFDRLSKLEPYRSVYASVCPSLGCTLPELRSLEDIRASNLIVRSHPDLQDALVVDLVLQNNAAFEQRFPRLILSFKDINNKTLAEREFKPQEYLGGELSGAESMPINTPVHIALELVDPGNEAVSYSASLRD